MKLRDEVTLTRADLWLIAGNIMLLAALGIRQAGVYASLNGRLRDRVDYKLTGSEQVQAAKAAKLRQGAAERRGFSPCGLGNVSTHYYGYGSELAAARLLGVPVPKEWDWESDRERGCDLVAFDGTKVHVRSCRNGLEWVWRDGKDSETGIWIFADTSRFPVVKMAGWLYGKVAVLIADQDVICREWLLDMQSCPVIEETVSHNEMTASPVDKTIWNGIR